MGPVALAAHPARYHVPSSELWGVIAACAHRLGVPERVFVPAAGIYIATPDTLHNVHIHAALAIGVPAGSSTTHT
jgi:hypothetical protein